MGKIHLHTQEQKIILDQVKKSGLLEKDFYFTGGTALSSVYLHHRLSDDLDFFSPKTFDTNIILTLVKGWSEKCNFTYTSEFIHVVYIFNVTFSNGEKLKIDFATYPYKQLEKPNLIETMQVDSLLDIAVNKLLTITQREQIRDFIDLYYLINFPRPYGRGFSLFQTEFALHLFSLGSQYTL